MDAVRKSRSMITCMEGLPAIARSTSTHRSAQATRSRPGMPAALSRHLPFPAALRRFLGEGFWGRHAQLCRQSLRWPHPEGSLGASRNPQRPAPRSGRCRPRLSRPWRNTEPRPDERHAARVNAKTDRRPPPPKCHRAGDRPHEDRRPPVVMPVERHPRRCPVRRPLPLQPQHLQDPGTPQVLACLVFRRYPESRIPPWSPVSGRHISLIALFKANYVCASATCVARR